MNKVDWNKLYPKNMDSSERWSAGLKEAKENKGLNKKWKDSIKKGIAKKMKPNGHKSI